MKLPKTTDHRIKKKDKTDFTIKTSKVICETVTTVKYKDLCNCVHPLPEQSEGSEVLKIAVRDDKCRGGAMILAAGRILVGAEVIQGDQLRESGAGGPAAP